MADENKPAADAAKPATAPKAEPTREQMRAEFDSLLTAHGLSVTPKSDDPKESEKKGPPLTPDQSRRLHALHGLLATPDDLLYRQKALSADQAKRLRDLLG